MCFRSLRSWERKKKYIGKYFVAFFFALPTLQGTLYKVLSFPQISVSLWMAQQHCGSQSVKLQSAVSFVTF